MTPFTFITSAEVSKILDEKLKDYSRHYVSHSYADGSVEYTLLDSSEWLTIFIIKIVGEGHDFTKNYSVTH